MKSAIVFAFTILAMLAAVEAVIPDTGIPPISGTVKSLNGNHFIMDSETEMKVYVDANTVYRINGAKASASNLVKRTKVTCSGASGMEGFMNAILVEITPTGTEVTGAVKKVGSNWFMLECGEKTFKVYGWGFTKFESDRAKHLKVGMKVRVTPVTDNPKTIDAYRIATDDEPSPGSR